ncbi:putative transcription factor C2H2 family [Rosa chinensis]|uniref:RING-type E3 ubiquitin transferase n=1 Tax=Rosa chinensis TaxID=74649 RepID=A0A2P6QSB0_ROSCH|nr:RING-H2 finger protein ATL43 [Rosa chinensis]PRQ37073.1 putative transcription factor C2H2 family [Rosa chinensis]
MGCLLFLSLKPTTTAAAAFFVLLITLLSFLSTLSNADPDPDPKIGDIATTSASPPPPVLNVDTAEKPKSFRPSMAIMVGVLTTLFSFTFLLLLYAKHCKRGSFVVIGGTADSGPPGGAGLRKNSGIDRAVVESLPVFRFRSLRGHKDGLECAVCLTRFEPTEVLRLLPKCKHAFHVECVDTWLDAHSTCPLCRYRVDPEDILLIEDARILHHQNSQPQTPHQNDVVINVETDPGIRRVSGRHSSALEQRPGSSSHDNTSSFRRSLDSWTWFRKKTEPAAAAAGSQERPRKDGLLLSHDKTRLEHRIIVSSPRSSNTSGGGFHQRWSDVQPSDLLYLRSEMIISDNGLTRQGQEEPLRCGNGRGVINERSVSEITGLSRFSNRGSSNERSNQHHQNQNQNQNHQQRYQQRQLRLVSRWVAWISSQSRPAARSDRTTGASSPTTPQPAPPPPPLPTVATA